MKIVKRPPEDETTILESKDYWIWLGYTWAQFNRSKSMKSWRAWFRLYRIAVQVGFSEMSRYGDYPDQFVVYQKCSSTFCLIIGRRQLTIIVGLCNAQGLPGGVK